MILGCDTKINFPIGSQLCIKAEQSDGGGKKKSNFMFLFNKKED